jgi:hypothetical protein
MYEGKLMPADQMAGFDSRQKTDFQFAAAFRPARGLTLGSICLELYYHSPHTLSWRGAETRKHIGRYWGLRPNS